MRNSNFDMNSLYEFDMKKYKNNMERKINSSSGTPLRAIYERSYKEGLETFAKELEEGIKTFVVIGSEENNIGLFTCSYNDLTYAIEPEWCNKIEK